MIYALSVFFTSCAPQQYKDLPESNWIGIEDGDTIDLYERRGDYIYYNELGHAIFEGDYDPIIAAMWVEQIIQNEGIEFYNNLRYQDSLCVERHRPISINATNFSVCKGSGYARDLDYVYYPIVITCEDSETECECEDCYLSGYIVEDANPKYFKYVKDGYGVDRWKMYKDGIRIEWDDSIFEKE